MPPSRSLDYHIQKWLAYGERVFKVDLHYLLKGGFWSTVGQFGSSVSALVLSIAISSWVPKGAYGEYKYVLAFVAVLGAFCLNGMSTAVFQSTARGFGKSLPEGMVASLKWSVLIFLGALGIGAYYLVHGNEVLGIGILIGGCLSPFLASANLYDSFLAGKKDFQRQSLYGIIGTALPAFILLVTAYFSPTPLALILAYFIGNTGVTIFLYYLTLTQYTESQEPRDPEMIGYAKHQSVMGILSTIAGNVDQLFLFHFAGAIEVAIYNFATGVLDQSKGPLKSLDTMVQARFANQKTKSIRESMNNKMLLIFISTLIVIVLYIIAAPFIYRILFPNYMSAVIYSQVYALSMLGLWVSPAGSYLSVKKKVKELYFSTLSTSLLQIVATFVGIITFGLWGLIWARIIIRLGGNLVLYILYLHAVKDET